MDTSTFKTPSRAMAATITLVLLVLFALSYLMPMFTFSWINHDAKFDAGLQQTLLTLLVLSVGYYIGSSKSSADSGDAMRAQIASTVPAAAVAESTPKPKLTVTTEAGP